MFRAQRPACGASIYHQEKVSEKQLSHSAQVARGKAAILWAGLRKRNLNNFKQTV